MTNEIYYCLIGKVRKKFWWAKGMWGTEGQPAEVVFDYAQVIQRDDTKHDVVGFFHTHPQMSYLPSSTDYDTMGAWTNCLGKPLVCVIKGCNGIRAHWFIDDETKPITQWTKKIGSFFIGRTLC